MSEELMAERAEQVALMLRLIFRELHTCAHDLDLTVAVCHFPTKRMRRVHLYEAGEARNDDDILVEVSDWLGVMQ